MLDRPADVMPLLPQLEIKPATILSPGAVLIMSMFGLFLLIPVLASMVAVSVLKFGLVTFLLPLLTIAAATFFLPLGFGNPYVAKLVRSLKPESSGPKETYIVQLTRVPRQRAGLWAILEDADDIGWLEFTESSVVFAGDSVHLAVPYGQIRELRRQNAGWRALFAYGSQTAFSINGLPEAGTFLFAERASWLLPTSRKLANRIFQRLREKHQPEGRQARPEAG